jgi:hypothetical protein
MKVFCFLIVNASVSFKLQSVNYPYRIKPETHRLAHTLRSTNYKPTEPTWKEVQNACIMKTTQNNKYDIKGTDWTKNGVCSLDKKQFAETMTHNI